MSRRIIDKEALVAAIKQSQELSDEQKADIIELIRAQKKYGLVWEDSPEDAVQELKTKLPILREVTERRILNDADGEHYPNHVLIEGENLQALVALSYTHAGMIDVIYIDPPYNTGNKDFVYNDKFVDTEDGYRHSKWLSFMEKRLKVAKQLLSPNGVIFISVDDNEQAQLRVLLDEIFKSKSLDRGTLIWVNRGSTKGFSKIVKNHEYILAFSNNPDAIKSLYNKNFPADGELIEERLQIKRSPKNPICRIKFPKGLPIRDVKNIRFEGHVGNGTNRIDIVSGDMVFKEGILQNDIVLEASFPYRNQTEKFFSAMGTGEPVYDTKGQQWLEVFFSKTGVPHYSKQRGFTILSSLLDDVPNSGFSDLKALSLEAEFSNPKPVALIAKLLAHFSTENYTILDFFAGSGTTLHATMQLNAEDGGHRQCILVTNNENGICENVTYERNKRVIQGYTTPKGEEVPGLTKNNLRYYKLKAVPRDSSTRSRMKLAAGSVDMLCIMENLYKEKDGFGNMGYYKGLRYFEENGRGMLVLLNTDLIPEVVEQLKQMEPATPVHIYVYAPGDYAFDDEFKEVADKVELYPLPQPIMNAYKNWLPKQDEVMLDMPDDYELSEAELNESAKDFISKEE